MLGWEMSPDQLGSDRLDLAGPVAGLHLVGHWTRPGGGITPVLVSAAEVARRITSRAAAASVPLNGAGASVIERELQVAER
jgi:phytoene dehydrogenase-like protein